MTVDGVRPVTPRGVLTSAANIVVVVVVGIDVRTPGAEIETRFG